MTAFMKFRKNEDEFWRSIERKRKQSEEAIDELEGLDDLKENPFHSLIEYIYTRVRGLPADIPVVPPRISNNHAEMFERARQILLDDNTPEKKSFLLSKDVLVLASGIIDTVSDANHNLSLNAEIQKYSLLPSFSVVEEYVKELMDAMHRALCPGDDRNPLATPDLSKLKMWIWGQLAALDKTPQDFREMTENILLVVNHLCSCLETDELAPPVTEHTVVSLWAFVLNRLMGRKSIRVIP
ncbi:hypothetical protein BX616_008320, partial [Lobosporangium transversale]